MEADEEDETGVPVCESRATIRADQERVVCGGDGDGDGFPKMPLGLRFPDLQAWPSQLHDMPRPSLRLCQMRPLFSFLLQVSGENRTLFSEITLPCLQLNWVLGGSRVCVSRFNDCPLCGADIVKIESNSELQGLVDRFIEGHARIKRAHNAAEEDKNAGSDGKRVIYEDVSLERGAFLVQQAMRVSVLVCYWV